MPLARRSRHHRSRSKIDIIDRLTKILRTLGVGHSGRHQRSGEGHRYRRGTFASHRGSQQRRETAGFRPWTVKQEISLRRLGAIVCVLLVFIWVGWRIIAQTAAQSLAKSHPDSALSWVTDQSTALNQLAQRELVDPDGNLDSAREWAQRALRSNPLNARALTLLGLIAERKGDQKSADALMRISGARTLRDPTAAAWLFNREVRRGDYPHALPYMDALLRIDLESRKRQFFPILAGFTANPLAFKALTDFLATSPPWRTWFLSELSVRFLANQARLVELYTALTETENPPTKEELRPYLNRLIKDRSFEQAHQTWHQALPPEQRAHETYPFNRDFGIPVDDLPFNWNLESIPGAHIQIASSVDGGRKRALLVQFSGARVRFANVKQLMLLPAGDHTFSGSVKTDKLLTSRGLWWHIFCANDPATTLTQTELVSGTLPWTNFTVKFQVPTTDCRAQWLRLELPARIEPEMKIAGQVWYQNLRIAPFSTTGVAPLGR
jgi:tetratricopeptide (TPR) repeat protein